MASTSNLQVTISLADPSLDEEELQEQVENLLPQLKEVDGVEDANLVPVEQAPPGSKALGGFLLGVLTAEVNPANIKTVFRWLSDRVVDKPLEISLKMPDGTVISGKATSQADKDYLSQKVDEVLQRGKK